jgi:hypothetical protein
MRYPATLHQFFILIFCLCNLLFINTAMAKKDDFIIKTDSLDLPRTTSATRSSSGDEVEIIPLGTPEFPGLCRYRGHVGKYQCKEVTAEKHGRYSCKGKNVIYSKVDGVGACYSCPDGYGRASLTRKMNHPKACEKHQKGKNAYTSATKLFDLVKCSDGQFKHKGYCKSCPAKTNRKHVAGLDSGKCKVEKEYRCNAGLKLHKSAPKNIWDRGGNWLGLKHKKYCGLPFDLKAYAEEIVASDSNTEVLRAMVTLGDALGAASNAGTDRFKNMKKAIKKKRLNEAFNLLNQFPEFQALKNSITSSQDAFSESGADRANFTITIGVGVDGSFVFGGNYEKGIAYDFTTGGLKYYQSYGLTKGISISVDGAVNVGIWKGAFVDSYSQGYTLGVPVMQIGYSGSADLGLGVWSDYYTPKRADGLNQPHFVGITGLFGVGAGFEIGEYSEVWTDVKD